MTDTSIASGAFPPATAADWRALVEKTLKDAPFESLQRTTLEGLPIAPLYEAGHEGPKFTPRPHDAERPWELRAAVAHPDPARARADLLTDLEGGAASGLVRLDPTGAGGVAVGSAADLARVLDGVMLELAPVALDAGFLGPKAADWPLNWTKLPVSTGALWADAAPAVTLLDTLEALTEFQRAGKIRYIGVSNETAFGVMRYLHLADKHDLPRIVTIQNPYSLLNRSFEVGLAEVSQFEGVELLAYSCLAFGTLTGKYLNGAKPAGARNTLFSRFTRYSSEQSQKAVAAYVDIAKRHGLDPAQMALAFVRRQPFVASTLLGATTMAQLQANVESLQLELSEEVLAEIEAVHQVYTYPAP